MSKNIELCECCERRPVEVLFKATPKREDWLLRECDRCLELLCDECGDTDSETGEVTCLHCLQNDAVMRHPVTHP